MRKLLLLVSLTLLVSCDGDHITFYDAFVNAMLSSGIPVLLFFFGIAPLRAKRDRRFKGGMRNDKTLEGQAYINGIKYGILTALVIGIPLTLLFYIFNIRFNLINFIFN